jgi:tetratricopeptide (TPR) repeat protein
VRELIRGQLVGVTPPAHEVLAAAAVLGSEATFERLCQVAELNESAGLAALDDLRRRRLIIENAPDPELQGDGFAGPATFGLPHDLVRDVVYTEAGDTRRRIFHRRAFAVLEGSLGPPADLARHALAAGLNDPAFRYSVAAGDAALALFALRDAIVHYERARRLLSEPSGAWEPWVVLPANELEHAYVNLARTYDLAGDGERAHATYVELRRAARERRKLPLECAALNRLAVHVAQQTFDPQAALALLLEARTAAERSEDRALIAETDVNIAQVAALGWQMDVAIRHGEQALALARELGLSELTARALTTQAWNYFHASRWDMAVTHAREALSLFVGLRDWSPPTGVVAPPLIFIGFPPSSAFHVRAMEAASLWIAGDSSLELGDPQAAIEAGREALALGRAFNNAWVETWSRVHLAPALLETGAYEESLAVARDGLPTARRQTSLVLVVGILTSVVDACSALLRTAEGYEACQEMLALRKREQKYPRGIGMLVAWRLCTNRALAGDWEVAAMWAREAMQLRHDAPVPLVLLDFHRYHEIEALLRVGDHEPARRDVEEFGERVGANRRFRLPYLRCRALLAVWDGETAHALALLNEALMLAQEIGLPGEEWQIVAELAAAYRREGALAESGQALAQAQAVITALAQRIEEPNLRETFLAAALERALMLAT